MLGPTYWCNFVSFMAPHALHFIGAEWDLRNLVLVLEREYHFVNAHNTDLYRSECYKQASFANSSISGFCLKSLVGVC